MALYRKKPVVIEAFNSSWNLDGWPDWAEALAAKAFTNGPNISIKTLEGEMIVNPGDWIIKGVAGEIYPCKPHIFEATYEPVD